MGDRDSQVAPGSLFFVLVDDFFHSQIEVISVEAGRGRPVKRAIKIGIDALWKTVNRVALISSVKKRIDADSQPDGCQQQENKASCVFFQGIEKPGAGEPGDEDKESGSKGQ
jgi:hypothetical protein